MTRVPEYATRLFLHWLNERYRREFKPTLSDDGAWRATDPEAGDLAIATALLYEGDDAWFERAAELEQRLNDTRPGSYLLWVPPGGKLPDGEPDESEWVRRVVLGASKLASGRNGEVRLPVRMALGKVRDEGGYASVTGGLGRHWPDISQRLNGSFYLDSRGLNRFSRDEDEREQLFDHIGLLSQGLKLGDVVEFEHEDAWNIQRLPARRRRRRHGGRLGNRRLPARLRALRRRRHPPTPAPSPRRSQREAAWRIRARRASSCSSAPSTTSRARIAGSSLRGFDPTLAAAFDVIALVSDAEVKALRLARGARFTREP